VFAVEWNPREIRWYRDGQLYHTAKPALVKGDWVFSTVLLLLNGGGRALAKVSDADSAAQRMLVDYDARCSA
jgi:beta-glucanase (GH16 family)